MSEISAFGALVGVAGVGPLQPLDPILGSWKSGHRLAIAQKGVAPTMISVEMGVDDDVNVLRDQTQALQAANQAPLAHHIHQLSHLG
jgi:hypothetical protein